MARGSGTGLAGGATPVDDPLVIVTTHMNRILEVDAEAAGRVGRARACSTSTSRRAVTHLGLHYAPDPSSQQACTIGGNVATTPAARTASPTGVTSTHVLAIDVVLADGSHALGGLEPDSPGYDLRGCFVGCEGTMGIATRIAVRLMPDPPAVADAAARLRRRSTPRPRP